MFEIAHDARTRDAYRAAHDARGHALADFLGWLRSTRTPG